MTYKMKAGTYYVGDPCYVFSSDEWDKVWDCFGDGLDEVNGKDVWSMHTMYGDGAYRGNDHKTYGVDSGCLGVVPVEVITQKIDRRSMNVVEFEQDFECSWENGFFQIGHIGIQTN